MSEGGFFDFDAIAMRRHLKRRVREEKSRALAAEAKMDELLLRCGQRLERALAAEARVARLEKALREIVEAPRQRYIDSYRIARAALEEEGEKL